MNKFLKALFILLFSIGSFAIFGQKQAKLLKSESSFVIKGTSSLHDWEEKVLQFDTELQVVLEGSKLTNVEKGLFKATTKSIESGNSIMNKKTYEALKADAHPEIIFKPKKIEKLVSDNVNYSCTVIGDLYIAGVTKTVAVPISGSVQNNRLTIKGSSTINMPDYKVEPPTALMGTIKTGPKIDLVFSLTFLL